MKSAGGGSKIWVRHWPRSGSKIYRKNRERVTRPRSGSHLFIVWLIQHQASAEGGFNICHHFFIWPMKFQCQYLQTMGHCRWGKKILLDAGLPTGRFKSKGGRPSSSASFPIAKGSYPSCHLLNISWLWLKYTWQMCPVEDALWFIFPKKWTKNGL